MKTHPLIPTVGVMTQIPEKTGIISPGGATQYKLYNENVGHLCHPCRAQCIIKYNFIGLRFSSPNAIELGPFRAFKEKEN